MLSKQWMMTGIFFGLFGVVLGAFGAHALKASLNESAQAIYHTAVQYQFYHAFALLALGIWAAQNPLADTQIVGWAFTVGTLIFSGSLYVLAITQLKFLGAITPIGGVSFIIGWIAFAFLVWKA